MGELKISVIIRKSLGTPRTFVNVIRVHVLFAMINPTDVLFLAVFKTEFLF